MSRRQLIANEDLPLYRPGTIVVASKSDVYFIAAALSDERDDIFLSGRKYADQGKALDFAMSWFDRRNA